MKFYTDSSRCLSCNKILESRFEMRNKYCRNCYDHQVLDLDKFVNKKKTEPINPKASS